MFGALWTIGTSLGARVLGVVCTLALTWYLTPEQVGEVSAAIVVVFSANVFSTLGLGQYIVAKKDVDRGTVFQLTALYLGIGLVVVLGSWAMGPFFAARLNAPTMTRFLPGIVVSVVVERLGFVPEKILLRNLEFRTQSLAKTGGELTYSLGSIGLAAFGFGGMSIVWANVGRAFVRSGICIAAVKRAEWLTPTRMSWTTLKGVLAFSIPTSIAASAAFAAGRWDNAFVANLYSAEVMGLYERAYNLADLPADQIGEQLADVLLPSFARMEGEQRRNALLRAIGVMSIIICPLAIGLGAVAHTLVATILRKEWLGVAPMLAILAALSVVRPIGWLIASYFLAANKPRWTLGLELVKLFFLAISMYSLGRIGPLWACVAAGLAFAAQAVVATWAVIRLDGGSYLAFAKRLLPPIVACIPMTAAVVGARTGLLAVGWHAGWKLLIVEIAIGAVAYVAGAFVLARTLAFEVVDLVMEVVKRRRGGGTPSDPPSSR